MVRVNAIDHLNMTVNDLDESISFYSKIFGFEVVEDSRKEDLSPNKLGTAYAVIGLKGSVYLVLHQSLKKGHGQDGSDPVRIVHFGLHVADFDAVVDTLKATPISLLYGDRIFEWPHSRSFYVLDPSGHEIELVEHFGGREI